MRSVEMKNRCLLYYGNPVGYRTEQGVVADSMFRREELEDWLARKGLAVRWEDGIYDRLSSGGYQKAADNGPALKSCRIWQLGPSAPAAMRFIGLDRMSGEYGGPDLTRYQAVFDGTVSTNSLDGIWEAFCRRSLGSDGQPLAISDLVELYDDSGSEFYYATADLAVGDYIIPSKLSDAPAAENAYLYSLDGSQQAISVSIKSFAEGLSGKLQSGDIVSVIAPDYKQQGQTVVPAELQYVEIISVTASSGYDANTGEPVDEEDDKELPDTVTLLVSPEQAKVLAELEAEGTIHLALVYRGDRENADKFLTSQDEIILELYPPEPDPEEKPQENPAESEPAAASSETAETEAPAKTEEVA